MASLYNPDASPIPIIMDSGSDITLISQKALEQMRKPPKIKTGQRIKLVQVTGNTMITGYVILNVYFESDEGPVLIKVEAYVVKGMSTPFILGNDFADQYSISLLRKDGESTLLFGKSGRSRRVHSSVTSTFLDEDGHAFKIRARPDFSTRINKAKAHRKSQKLKCRSHHRTKENYIRAASPTQIAPGSTRLVKIQANFVSNSDMIFVEKKLVTNGDPEDIYGCADTLITKESPFIYVTNFSKKPINISVGQVVAVGHDPSAWLDKESQYTKKEIDVINTHANLLRSIINSGGTSIDKNLSRKRPKVKLKAFMMCREGITLPTNYWLNRP